MLTQCDAEGGPEYLTGTFEALFNPVMDADLYYVSYGYGGVVSSDYDDIVQGLVTGLAATQLFVNHNISLITAPVIILEGVDDTMEPIPNGIEFWNQLNPKTQAKSAFVNFTEESGGALHCQVGAEMALDTQVWNWVRELGIIPPKPKPSSSSSAAITIMPSGVLFALVFLVTLFLQK
jgi:hypothetical protein